MRPTDRNVLGRLRLAVSLAVAGAAARSCANIRPGPCGGGLDQTAIARSRLDQRNAAMATPKSEKRFRWAGPSAIPESDREPTIGVWIAQSRPPPSPIAARSRARSVRGVLDQRFRPPARRGPSPTIRRPDHRRQPASTISGDGTITNSGTLTGHVGNGLRSSARAARSPTTPAARSPASPSAPRSTARAPRRTS